MKTKEVLEKAKSLISRPQDWFKGNYAADENNKHVLVREKGACKWCALGAVMAVCNITGLNELASAKMFLDKAVMNTPGCQFLSTTKYNDNHTHEEIMELFDRAIKMCGNI